ncbi:hypothetical protein FACS189496_3730 [Bacilli bacterium]|nr:hypothetical protein FACS189496_3730 [Bacilli bacterium]
MKKNSFNERFQYQCVYTGLCIVLFLIVLSSAFGEKVAYNDGAGWDGLFYRNVCYDFSDMILDHQYDTYRIQRILPFGIINVIYNLFHIDKTNSSFLYGIQILNIITLGIGVFYFFRVSKKLEFSVSSVIIGFSAIFFNYPILKLMGYYPFLTDTYALVLAIIQFNYFVSKRTIQLVIVSIFGAFTWPALFLCGLILAFLPGREIELQIPQNKLEKKILSFLKMGISVAIPIIFILVFYFYYVVIRGHDIQNWYTISVNWFFIILALITTPIYIWLLIKPINISFGSTIKNFFMAIKPLQIGLLVIVYIVIKSVQQYLSNGTALVSIIGMVAGRILIPATQAPFAYLVCNFMYYGLIVIFLCIYWNDAIKRYANYGYSFFIVIILGLIMSLNTESRHLLSFVPFLILPFIEVINKRFNVKFSIIFSIASLALSRFWFKINVEGIEEAFEDWTIGSYESFPAQRYFMAQGPWMSYSMYVLFLGVFVLSFISGYLYLKKVGIFSKNK